MQSLRLIAIFFTTLFLVEACASTPQSPTGPAPSSSAEILEELTFREPNPKPDWVLKGHPEDQKFFYFVGFSSKHTEERDARRNAMVDATNKFVKYSGIEASVFEEYLAETQGSISGVLDSTITGRTTTRQQAEAYVSRMKEMRRYIEKYKLSQGGIPFPSVYKVVVLARVPQSEYDNVQKWKIRQEEEKKRRKQEQIQEIKETIDQFMQSSSKLAHKGQILSALEQLKSAKQFAKDSPLSNRQSYIAKIEEAENLMVGHIQITALENNQQIEPEEKPKPLIAIVSYQADSKKLLPDFPLIFHEKEEQFSSQTNSEGRAVLRLPAFQTEGQFDIRVNPAPQLESKISREAWDDLRTKQAFFTIEVKKTKPTPLEKMLQGIIASEFNFEISTNLKGNTGQVGEEVQISAKCAKRCYLRLYYIDMEGQVTILVDTKKIRLAKNRKSLIFKGATSVPGVSIFVTTASTEPFSQTYQPMIEIPTDKFLGLLTSFRDSHGLKAEIHTSLTIEP